MVEAKYTDQATTAPIRTAVGQLLEYNLYPKSEERDIWLVLVNRKPRKNDLDWIGSMRNGYGLEQFPVFLCWETKRGFVSEENVI